MGIASLKPAHGGGCSHGCAQSPGDSATPPACERARAGMESIGRPLLFDACDLSRLEVTKSGGVLALRGHEAPR